MSFGNILGQVLQNGLGTGSQTRDRVGAAGANLGGDKGIEGIFAQIQGALGQTGVDTAGATQAVGGFRDKAADFLQKDQIGGLSGAQVGGIGAIAGALLGGGLGGAARGGAMAVLGTLALGALKRAQGQGRPNDEIRVDQDEVKQLVGPDTERLALRAMISAAKADGKIDQSEMQKIVGKLSDDSVTAEENQFVLEQLSAPIDIGQIAAEVRSPAQAAEVYAASILTISADTDAERQYLRDLAAALNLGAATVQELHRMTGAPAV